MHNTTNLHASSRPRPFEVSPDLYPFEDHWFERDGTALHYIDTGRGLPVVLCHGNPTWSFLYRDVIHELSGVRALALDLPGYGMSEAPADFGYSPQEHAEWLGAWIDSLGLKRFVLVVQDWGGPTGLRVAVERAPQVAGLVVLNTWCWPADFKMRMMSRVLGGPLGRSLQKRRNFFSNVLVPKGMATEAEKSPEVLEAYNAPFLEAERRPAAPMLAGAIRKVDDWLLETQAGLENLRTIPTELV